MWIGSISAVLLTALAAVLAFIPLTQSVFWGPLAYTLIGGTAAGPWPRPRHGSCRGHLRGWCEFGRSRSAYCASGAGQY
jgi:hypothetical protein